jgi:hypothetical protein
LLHRGRDQPFQHVDLLPELPGEGRHEVRVAHRVQPELGLQGDELGVPVGHRHQQPGQLAEGVTRDRPVIAGTGLQDLGDRTDPVAHPRGQQLEEQLLLVREVGVQRAHRVAGRLGDLLHRGPGEALPGEQARGRVEQPLPRLRLGLRPGQALPSGFLIHIVSLFI